MGGAPTVQQQEAGGPQRPDLVRVDLPWCWSRSRIRWSLDPRPHVAERHPRCSPASHMALPRGREHLVPQTGGLLDGVLGHGPHDGSLRELLQR